MRTSTIGIFLLSLILVSHAANLRNGTRAPSTRQAQITRLFQRLQKEQQHEDVEFSYLPPVMMRRKGLYHSYIKVNIVDESNSDLINLVRKVISVYDVNMFVTNFILMAILEAIDLGTIPADTASITEAVQAILNYKDKNIADGIPMYTFWPQAQDKKTGFWKATPVNMINLVNLIPDIPAFMQPILQKLGLGMIALAKSLIGAFKIPSDVDDSSVNLALGEALRANQKVFPEAFKQWELVNRDHAAYFNLIKRFAYRPFANLNNESNPEVQPSNTSDYIDPRTYYYLRPFLDSVYTEAQAEGRVPNLILPTTWIIDKEGERELSPDVAMPLGSDNVDLTVNANFLYGTSTFLIGHPDRELVNQIWDEDLKQMFVDAAKMISWAIKSRVHIDRPDLCLVYYPSVHDFYWFVARTSFFLENFGQLPFPEMETVRDILASVLRTDTTSQLLQDAIYAPDNAGVYWQEFIGNYANKTRGADRLFATSMALNALLDTWTKRIGSGRLWLDNVPEAVLYAVKDGEKYLSSHIENWDASLENAFFSGSIKGFGTFPFVYPGNLAYYSNGTTFDPTKVTFETIATDPNYFMKGYVPADEYERMLNQTHFGFPVPRQFTGFNSEKGIGFPYWSSPAITYSMGLLALSKIEKTWQKTNKKTLNPMHIRHSL
eukprot:TRINITY_DN853_c0_g1_i10.p1 TRINITY_DN853_c0_g1~~TRINITY_DN853_c0_g1_i10.p1  ORF type:complete len:662 (+),score=259.08 TRINITY_DN853_c0_g1_i10:144-2129(+)